MKLNKMIGKPLEGVIFDGTFESSKAIIDFIDKHRSASIIRNLKIERFTPANIHGTTNLTFTIAGAKNDPNDKGSEVILRVGDFLVLEGAGFSKISAEMLRKFFTSADTDVSDSETL